MARRPISMNIQYHAINIVNVLLIFKDRIIINQAAGQEAIFNTRCRFQDFGYYDPANPIPFYSPRIWSALSQDLKVCQECYIASIAPTPLAKSFSRDNTLPQDSEQLIECVFSRPYNEPAWKAAIDQGHEGPLVHWMKEVDAQKENLSKCPQEANSFSQLPIGERITFYTLRGHTTFKICEYHFLYNVPGTWMEDEFVRQDHTSTPAGTLCDFGSCDPVASIILVLAKRAFNFKIFEDWARAYQYFPACNGIIEAGNKKYTLPAAVQYTSSEERFQVCETCYRLIFFPHAVIQPQFQEIAGAQNQTRGACTIDILSVMGYLQALLKATWKNNSLILLEFARDQVPVEPCPGSSSTTQKLWYAVTGVDAFVCCRSCFRTLVLPSTLYSSFRMISPLAGPMEYSCDLSNPQIRAIFVAACEAGRISVFRDGLDKRAAEVNDSLYPEEDLSGLCGTPEQIQQVKALAEEILDLQAEAQNLETFASHLYGNAFMAKGSGAALSLVCDDYESGIYYDGHGNYFKNSTQAEASALESEANSKSREASRLRLLVDEKRHYLRQQKLMLTKEP